MALLLLKFHSRLFFVLFFLLAIFHLFCFFSLTCFHSFFEELQKITDVAVFTLLCIGIISIQLCLNEFLGLLNLFSDLFILHSKQCIEHFVPLCLSCCYASVERYFIQFSLSLKYLLILAIVLSNPSIHFLIVSVQLVLLVSLKHRWRIAGMLLLG